MRRTPGWITLAGIALELAVLAFLSRVVYDDNPPAMRRTPRHGESSPASGEVSPDQDEVSLGHGEVSNHPEHVEGRGLAQTAVASSDPPLDRKTESPIDFLTEPGDSNAQYYRAVDGKVEMYAGFYADGRVRLADSQNRRFAGMLSNGHADLLEIANSAWSELFLRTTPEGRTQLELRGGPYDAHVLICEAFRV